MYRSKTEKLVDHVLGEAVLGLLSESAPVSDATVAVRLMEMAARETHPDRAEALRLVLHEVRAALPGARLVQSPEPLFMTVDVPPPGTRRH